MFYFEAFKIFFKIGAFTIGGGYAMVPLIEDEIVTKRKWIEQDDFLDLLAIAQSAPGILAVNIAIFVGYRLRGVKGSLVTSLGSILPSFLMILAIALCSVLQSSVHSSPDTLSMRLILESICHLHCITIRDFI